MLKIVLSAQVNKILRIDRSKLCYIWHQKCLTGSTDVQSIFSRLVARSVHKQRNLATMPPRCLTRDERELATLLCCQKSWVQNVEIQDWIIFYVVLNPLQKYFLLCFLFFLLSSNASSFLFPIVIYFTKKIFLFTIKSLVISCEQFIYC